MRLGTAALALLGTLLVFLGLLHLGEVLGEVLAGYAIGPIGEAMGR